MAMNGTILGTEIKTALVTAGLAVDDGNITAVWDEIGKAIVAHIQANGVVTTTVATGIPVTVNISTGIGATTGPGAGTGTIA